MATIAEKDKRLEALGRWAADALGLDSVMLVPASADASFRRYFRIELAGGRSLIAMDAPPERENLADFTRIARSFAALGLNVPRIVAENAPRGFALLGDLGSETYLVRLRAGADPAPLYSAAIEALVRLQGWPEPDLPDYDAALLDAEIQLFEDWLVGRRLGLELSAAERTLLAQTRKRLTALALAQPRVAVHRDYHSRNLMMSEPMPGILDFQDAVQGPVTYDLVSLLKDCYIVWPRERRLAWLREYRVRALTAAIPAGSDETEFIAWFEAMGIQRHLKAAGIFARLYHRDGKPDYLGDIPRTLGYVVETAADVPEFVAFGNFVAARVVPALTCRSAGPRRESPSGSPFRGDAQGEESMSPLPPAGGKGESKGDSYWLERSSLRLDEWHPVRAMMLAAGRGERLRPLTDTIPKALVEVQGKPLIVRTIERLRAAGVRDLVVNLGWLGARIRAALGDGAAFGVMIRYSDEGDNTLETAGGVINALPLLGAEPFWVVNSDILCDYAFPDPALAADDLAHFVMVDDPDRDGGDFALVGERVRETGGALLTYSGIGLYRPEFFACERTERKPLQPLMQRAIAAGRVAGEHYRGRWADIGTPNRLAAVRESGEAADAP